MNFLLRLLLVPLAGIFIWIARRAEDAYYQQQPRATELAVASHPQRLPTAQATLRAGSPRPVCLALLWHCTSPRPSLYYSLHVL